MNGTQNGDNQRWNALEVALPAEWQDDWGGFLRPQGAVEGAVADGFVEMRLADVVVAGQVGDGVGDFLMDFRPAAV